MIADITNKADISWITIIYNHCNQAVFDILYQILYAFVVNENVSMPSAPPPTQPRQKPTEPLPTSPFPVKVDIYQAVLEDNESMCEITRRVLLNWSTLEE